MTFKKTITVEIDDDAVQKYIDIILKHTNDFIAEYEAMPSEQWKTNSEEFYRKECRRREMYSNDPSLVIAEVAEVLNYKWDECEPDVMRAFTNYNVSETPFES